MKGAAPTPEFLPVSVDIHIQDKDVKMRSILIQPTDTLKELKDVFITHLYHLTLILDYQN